MGFIKREVYLKVDGEKPIKKSKLGDMFQFCKINKEEYWLPYDLWVESYIDGLDIESPYVFMNIKGYFVPMKVKDLSIEANIEGIVEGYDDPNIIKVRHFVRANKKLFLKHSQNKISDKKFLTGLQIAWTEENVERKFRTNDESSWAHARIGFFDKYEVFVLADDRAKNPHVHIWDIKTKGMRFSTAVELCSADYSYHFCNDVLDEKGKEALVDFFGQTDDKTGLNNWQLSIEMWVLQNEMDKDNKLTKKGARILKHSKFYSMPDYTELEEWHDSKASQCDVLFHYDQRKVSNIGAPYDLYLSQYSSFAFFEIGEKYVPIALANQKVQLNDDEIKEIGISKDDIRKLEQYVKENKYALMAYGMELLNEKQLRAYIKHHKRYYAWQIYEEIAYQKGETKYKDYCFARDMFELLNGLVKDC